MKIRPLKDRVVVQRIEEDEKTSGPGKLNDAGKRIPPQVNENDRVLFAKYAGTDLKIDGVEHLIMREDDILGIVEQ